MAVKVMVAPAIASGELKKKPTVARAAPAREKAEPRPKRRKSAVFDADGNEVFITLICLKCQKIRPLSQFGLRKMGDGSIRNQPYCRTCRSAPSSRADGAVKPEQGEVAVGESPVLGESPASAASQAPETTVPAGAPGKQRPGTVAAEVAAALWAGRR
ncbi:MAG TPA: hypothetical protein VEB43_02320 [Anaeromyxobacter sp.]|nr:hypothetical protein [Anaeromyxobacter sp.]